MKMMKSITVLLKPVFYSRKKVANSFDIRTRHVTCDNLRTDSHIYCPNVSDGLLINSSLKTSKLNYFRYHIS